MIYTLKDLEIFDRYINRIWPNYRTYPYKRTVKQFRSHQITGSVLFVYFLIKAYVMGTPLNCIYLSMQFKWVPIIFACIKKIRSKKKKQKQNKKKKKQKKKKKHTHTHKTTHMHQYISPLLIFFKVYPNYRWIHILPQLFPVILKNFSARCGN